MVRQVALGYRFQRSFRPVHQRCKVARYGGLWPNQACPSPAIARCTEQPSERSKRGSYECGSVCVEVSPKLDPHTKRNGRFIPQRPCLSHGSIDPGSDRAPSKNCSRLNEPSTEADFPNEVSSRGKFSRRCLENCDIVDTVCKTHPFKSTCFDQATESVGFRAPMSC